MAIAVVKFNGFEGIQVMDANSMNVIANEAVQFFALRNAPDEDLLLKLQKKSLLLLAEFSEVVDTRKMTKAQVSNIIIEKWELINRNFTASSGGLKRSIFDMPDPSQLPCGSTEAPHFGDEETELDEHLHQVAEHQFEKLNKKFNKKNDGDGADQSEGSITPKTPVHVREFVDKLKTDGYGGSTKKQWDDWNEHKQNKEDHYHRKVKKSMDPEKETSSSEEVDDEQ